MTKVCRPWTTHEIKRLQKLWPDTRRCFIVPSFPGRSINALVQKASELGLHKNYPSKHLPSGQESKWKPIVEEHAYQTPYFEPRPEWGSGQAPAAKPE